MNSDSIHADAVLPCTELKQDDCTEIDESQHYHSNRLEGIALFRGLKLVSKFLDFYIGAQFGHPAIDVQLLALTDSSTAKTWALKGSSSDGYESRMIERLCEGLRQEILHLRTICSFNLEHLPGTENAAADSLSRILERPIGNATLAEIVRKYNTKTKKSEESVLRVTEDSGTGDEDVPLAESVAADSYSWAAAISKFALLRVVLISWRGAGRRLDAENAPVITIPLDGEYLDVDFKNFCLSAQSQIYNETFTRNPFRKNELGIIEHRRIEYDGSISYQVLIPKSCPVLQNLIVRTYHRLCYHRGASYTASYIKSFWLESRSAAVARVLRSCFRCLVKNAKTQWSLPTATEPRRLDLPPFSRIAIDHLHLESTVVLSIICIDTGVFAMMTTPSDSTSIEDAIVAIRRLTNRHSVNLRKIHCDQASSFRSPKFLAGLRVLGQDPEITFTIPNAPYTNPVERMHREVLSIIRTEKFLRLCVLEKDSKQDSLDEIANIINQRPIGAYTDSEGVESVLTPARLAWGGQAVSNFLPNLRKFFYEQCFDKLRRVGQVNRSQRRGNVIVGQRALLFNKQVKKLESPFELCRVVDIQGRYILVRTTDGKEKQVGSAQLAPLELTIQPDLLEATPYDVSRVGARISSEYNDNGEIRQDSGTVVSEQGDLVEVMWDPIGDRSWEPELVSWGACSVLAN